MRGQGITPRHKPWIPGWCPCDGAGVTSQWNDWTKGRHRRGTRAAAQSPAQYRTVSPVLDEGTIKTPNPKCCLTGV